MLKMHLFIASKSKKGIMFLPLEFSSDTVSRQGPDHPHPSPGGQSHDIRGNVGERNFGSARCYPSM